MLEKLLLPELREAVQTSDWKSVGEFTAFVHPSVIAQMFVDLGDFETVWATFEHVEPQAQAQIMEYLPPEQQDEIGRAHV